MTCGFIVDPLTFLIISALPVVCFAMEAAQRSPPPHNIALLPSPGLLGHLIPFLELAKKLVLHHNCTVTLIIANDGTADMRAPKSLLEGIPTAINPVFLPRVPTDDLPENVSAEVLAPTRVIRSLPALRHTLSSFPAAALVMDLFAPYAIDVAREFGIPAYIFYTASANDLSLAMDMPEVDKSLSTSQHAVKLPGSVVLKREDYPDMMQSRESEAYKLVLDLCSKYLAADGILVNSFLGLESEALHELLLVGGGQGRRIPPIYPVGPLIKSDDDDDDDDDDDHYCLKWLNDQPPKTVLFVSFGSGGTLSTEQFTELALGLEMSGHRFLWVVRSPQEDVRAGYFNQAIDDQTSTVDTVLEHLLPGFLERTKGRGLVVNRWAPQVRVLSHGATAGFLTHCGWNSILESVVFGVPMIAWPLCFDHKMNAVILTDGLEGAIRVKENQNGIVEKGCVSQVVTELMEGERGNRIRNRIMDAKIAARDAMGRDGSSAQALAQLLQKWIHGN